MTHNKERRIWLTNKSTEIDEIREEKDLKTIIINIPNVQEGREKSK